MRADRCQLHIPLRALEEPHVQLPLQRLYRLAERRLRHVETSGRMAEMQLFGDGDELAELPQIHDAIRLICFATYSHEKSIFHRHLEGQ
ncbi:hypothetical protein FQZ97_1187450 [compost metagenome]